MLNGKLCKLYSNHCLQEEEKTNAVQDSNLTTDEQTDEKGSEEEETNQDTTTDSPIVNSDSKAEESTPSNSAVEASPVTR